MVIRKNKSSITAMVISVIFRVCYTWFTEVDKLAKVSHEKVCFKPVFEWNQGTTESNTWWKVVPEARAGEVKCPPSSTFVGPGNMQVMVETKPESFKGMRTVTTTTAAGAIAMVQRVVGHWGLCRLTSIVPGVQMSFLEVLHCSSDIFTALHMIPLWTWQVPTEMRSVPLPTWHTPVSWLAEHARFAQDWPVTTPLLYGDLGYNYMTFWFSTSCSILLPLRKKVTVWQRYSRWGFQENMTVCLARAMFVWLSLREPGEKGTIWWSTRQDCSALVWVTLVTPLYNPGLQQASSLLLRLVFVHACCSVHFSRCPSDLWLVTAREACYPAPEIHTGCTGKVWISVGTKQANINDFLVLKEFLSVDQQPYNTKYASPPGHEEVRNEKSALHLRLTLFETVTPVTSDVIVQCNIWHCLRNSASFLYLIKANFNHLKVFLVKTSLVRDGTVQALKVTDQKGERAVESTGGEEDFCV